MSHRTEDHFVCIMDVPEHRVAPSATDCHDVCSLETTLNEIYIYIDCLWAIDTPNFQNPCAQ